MDISQRFVGVFGVVILVVHIILTAFNSYTFSLVDDLMSLISGIWLALLFFLFFKHFVNEHIHHHATEKTKILIIVLSFVCLLSFLWESQEFIFSELLSVYLQQSIGGMISDIALNIVGGLIIGATLIFWKKKESIS